VGKKKKVDKERVCLGSNRVVLSKEREGEKTKRRGREKGRGRITIIERVPIPS